MWALTAPSASIVDAAPTSWGMGLLQAAYVSENVALAYGSTVRYAQGRHRRHQP